MSLGQGLQKGVGSSLCTKNTKNAFCQINAPNALSLCASGFFNSKCPIKVPAVLDSLNAAVASPRGHWTQSLCAPAAPSGSPVCLLWGPKSGVVAIARPQGHGTAAGVCSPGRWCPGGLGCLSPRGSGTVCGFVDQLTTLEESGIVPHCFAQPVFTSHCCLQERQMWSQTMRPPLRTQR